MNIDKPPSAERKPEVSREKVIAVFTEGGLCEESVGLYSTWMEQLEVKRNAGEITDFDVFSQSIEIKIEAGLIREAVEECEEVLEQFGSTYGTGEMEVFCQRIISAHQFS
ncbi:MAG: hypothetical protein AB203_02735 [Parcubacteria bacterium C7867-008]|nr:MAG: hypothetical protein AB203_02735 [Parcubacteria bacterium C7867-008]